MSDLFKRIMVALLAAEYPKFQQRNRVNAAAWRAKNPEKQREHNRLNRLRNPETKKRCTQAWYDRVKNTPEFKAKCAEASMTEIARKQRSDYAKRDRASNPEKYKARSKTYIEANRSVLAEKKRIKYASRSPDEREADRIRKRNYSNHRAASDPFFRLRRSFGVKISTVLKNRQTSSTFESIVGCNREQLMAHLEAQFLPGMTWDNYGRYGWHVDHKHPVSKFDLTDVEAVKKCWHFSNLQPLWWRENIVKGNKLPC